MRFTKIVQSLAKYFDHVRLRKFDIKELVQYELTDISLHLMGNNLVRKSQESEVILLE